MREKAFDRNGIFHIGVQVAEALDFAHQKNIVHRDIKPSNINDLDDNAKLTHFGIAHIEDPAITQKTIPEEILGTPLYMSPEQVKSIPVEGRYDLMVPDDSPVYDRAQQGIRRIRLASQQERRRDRNLAQLLQEAELLSKAKRYLTPVNNNAYSAYKIQMLEQKIDEGEFDLVLFAPLCGHITIKTKKIYR